MSNKKHNNNIIKISDTVLNDDTVNIDDVIYIKESINKIVKEYKVMLSDNKDIDNIPNNILYDNNSFMGLIKYINMCLFSDNKFNIELSNYKHYSIDCYSDLSLLSFLWDIYINLCSMFHNKPLLSLFGIMCNIDKYTFGELLNGKRRATPDYVRLLKQWITACETAQMAAQDVKSIFLLKAVYGFSEEPQQTEITGKQIASLPVADDYLLTDK